MYPVFEVGLWGLDDNGKWINDALGHQLKEMLILTKKSNERKQIVHCGSSSPKLLIVPCSSVLPQRRQRSTVNLPLLLELAGYLLFSKAIFLTLYTHSSEGVVISAKVPGYFTDAGDSIPL